MNKSILSLAMLVITLFGTSCGQQGDSSTSGNASVLDAAPVSGQSSVQDDESQKDVVKVAVGSPDHTTLVTALKAAEYVDVLSNAGPFTVFAPTNAAFEKLPAGTVEGLLKPEKKGDLRTILEYHVYVGRLTAEMLQDGQVLGQASGHNATIAVKDGKVTINGANIIASIPASNGIIHVIDAVLLPPAK
jgi:uncharacterized surface protein with fasciclin (FAS1) repeats